MGLREDVRDVVDACRIPAEWEPSHHRDWERTWIRRDSVSHGVLTVQVMSGYRVGGILVSAGGCEIRCDSSNVQSAINHALRWHRAISKERPESGRGGK